MFYVYEWYRADLNLPYYVGKGKGKRAYDLKRNKHADTVTRYLSKNGIRRDVRIIAYFQTEEAAFDFEIERIAFWWHLKDHDILTNQTLGGEGLSGHEFTKEHKDGISKNNGMKRPEISKKISGEKHWLYGRGHLISGNKNPMFGRKGPLAPAYGRTNNDNQIEAIRKIGLRNKGSNNPNYGKITSDETKAKLSKSNKGQVRSEATKERMRKPRSEVGKAAIAASNRARAEKKRSEKTFNLLKGNA